MQFDPKLLYQALADLEPEERHTYMLIACMDAMANRIDKYKWIVPGDLIVVKKKKERKPKLASGEYSPEFESFWAAYPRRIAKGAAYMAWCKIKIDKKELETNCVLALQWQCQSENWTKDGGKYIPHPTTYLNQRRWEDEPEVPIQRKRSLGDLI